MYKLLNSSKDVRTGQLRTRAGIIDTPVFMPVGTHAAVKGMTSDQLEAIGAQIVLANTYHLHLLPGEKVVAKHGGLHQFMKWQRPILTDSGGFQVFSLSAHRKITEEGVTFQDPRTGNKIHLTPEKAIQIQFDLGADIIMAFDDVPGLKEKDPERVNEATSRSIRWLDRCLDEFKKQVRARKMTDKTRPLLFGIVQGGLDKKLRQHCLEAVQSTSVDGIAIGGLSVGEGRKDMYEILDFLSDKYDSTRAHYLMGVGDPKDVRFAIEHGIDMFDCVLPTRNARHGTVFISGDETLNLSNARFRNDLNPLDSKCDCPVCKTSYSRSYLAHLLRRGESLAGTLISQHNLRYLIRLTEEYR